MKLGDNLSPSTRERGDFLLRVGQNDCLGVLYSVQSKSPFRGNLYLLPKWRESYGLPAKTTKLVDGDLVRGRSKTS